MSIVVSQSTTQSGGVQISSKGSAGRVATCAKYTGATDIASAAAGRLKATAGNAGAQPMSMH